MLLLELRLLKAHQASLLLDLLLDAGLLALCSTLLVCHLLLHLLASLDLSKGQVRRNGRIAPVCVLLDRLHRHVLEALVDLYQIHLYALYFVVVWPSLDSI